jgi:cytochrome c oxidase cbb3-type subunit 4
MDINELRSAVTLILLLAFAGIVAWVYSGKRGAAAFERQAYLPLEGEDDARSDKQ